MTVTIQLSDKRGDAILVVKSEAPSVEIAEAEVAAAVGLVGLAAAYESFGTPPVATIPPIAQLTRPQEPWGNPPVPPMPAAAHQPAAAAPGAPGPAPVCQHGTKLYRSDVSAKTGRAWAAWFCPAPGNDATQCPKEWLR